MSEHDEMLEFLLQLAREAGAMALAYQARLSSLAVDFKAAKDLVTEADQGVERYLREKITARYPRHGILGEEYGVTQGNEYRWVIDPIDGTGSFVHGQPTFSISIGVELAGEGLLGSVNAPALEKHFYAQRGQGAWCNGQRIRCSTARQLDHCILSTGFACFRDGDPHNSLPYIQAILPQIRDLRRFGSAAIDLAFVAGGMLDAYWELNLGTHDIAAGMLIVREAGGRVTDFQGQQDKLPRRLFASNGVIHEPLLEVLNQVECEQDARLQQANTEQAAE